MDISARLQYFHDIFPYAELLPVNFYLLDTKNINLACNQATLQALGDKCITDYVDYSIFEYCGRKGWPVKMSQVQSKNNATTILKGQTIVCSESTMDGHEEKQWLSKKDPIYDNNGQPMGIIGISIPITYGNKSIYWDITTNRIVILFAPNYSVGFSMREFCVLQGLLNGATAEEIACQENISHKTIETYILRIKSKLKCQKSRDVISFCIKQDLAKEIIEFKHDFVTHPLIKPITPVSDFS